MVAPRDEQAIPQTLPPFGTTQDNNTFGGNTYTGNHPFAPQIDPSLQSTYPQGLAAPRQPPNSSNLPLPNSQFDQQHATRIFGQQHDPKSLQLQASVGLGPLPQMPTHESKAHQTLREVAPKLQALLDLFALAYETHDMEKVEELRRRLSWAIDAKGN